MRRLALAAAAAVLLAGCGGQETEQEKTERSVKEATERLRERVAKDREAKRKDPADEALLLIEKSDMPEDVKQQLLEAKELLDKQQK